MKGKHAAQAATRREATETAAQIEAYQHQVRRLSAENKRLMERLESITEALRSETRSLRAQVAEGTSARVAALERVANDWREKYERAAANNRRLQATHDRFVERFLDFAYAQGLSRPEALDLVVGGTVVGRVHPSKAGRPGAAEIERARRGRRGNQQVPYEPRTVDGVRTAELDPGADATDQVGAK